MAKNTTILEGTILGEPTLRTTQGGVHVSNFMLKVEDVEPNRSFEICITAWGKIALECATRHPKGAKIRVNGKLGRSHNTHAMEVHVENVISVD